MRSESTRRLTQPRTVLTWWSRPRLRPDPHLRTAPSAVLPGNRGSSSPPRRGVQWTMPDCFLCARCRRQVLICSRCDRGQQYCGARCSGPARRESLRAAGRRYQHSRRGRHCHAERQRRYRRRCGEDARVQKVTHHGSDCAPCGAELARHQVCDARGESADVAQTSHQASSRSERHFQDALPLLRAPGQRVRPPAVAAPAGTTTHSHRALSGEHDGDRRRTQGADPALPLRRTLAGGHHRLPARGPSLHRRAGAGRGRGRARAPAPASPLEARLLQSELA